MTKTMKENFPIYRKIDNSHRHPSVGIKSIEYHYWDNHFENHYRHSIEWQHRSRLHMHGIEM